MSRFPTPILISRSGEGRLGCADDVGGGVAERFKRSEQLVDAADRNDRNGRAFLVEVEIDCIDLATFGEAKLDHERPATFALQSSRRAVW